VYRKNLCKEQVMRGSKVGVMVLVALTGLALQCFGQTQNVSETGSQLMPVHYTTNPYKTETRSSSVWTKADGTTVTIERNSLFAIDSQGRTLQGGCIDGKLDPSCSLYEYTAGDPVAGTQTVWRPSTLQAKVFVNPSSIPGRKSCWKVSPEEEKVPKGDIPVPLKELKCPPAEESEGICWRGRAVKKTDNDTPVPESSYKDCQGAFQRTIFDEKKILQEKSEDLGTEEIEGFNAHGCQITTKYAEGILIREQWFTKFGPNFSLPGIVLREESQFTDSRSGTIVQSEALTALDTNEPDLKIFQPSKDYKIKTVEMHEVPCDELKQPAQ
jgi:hypothetical protein